MNPEAIPTPYDIIAPPSAQYPIIYIALWLIALIIIIFITKIIFIKKSKHKGILVLNDILKFPSVTIEQKKTIISILFNNKEFSVYYDENIKKRVAHSLYNPNPDAAALQSLIDDLKKIIETNILTSASKKI